VGRQAQTIPTLHSTADHDATPTLSPGKQIGQPFILMSPTGPRLTGWIIGISDLFQEHQASHVVHRSTGQIPSHDGWRRSTGFRKAEFAQEIVSCLHLQYMPVRPRHTVIVLCQPVPAYLMLASTTEGYTDNQDKIRYDKQCTDHKKPSKPKSIQTSSHFLSVQQHIT
jgi:hypothetical protein